MARVISVHTSGDFHKAEGLLHNIIQAKYRHKLDHYGQLGVLALKEATPKDSGLTADSWTYEIAQEGERLGLYWKNTNRNDGVLIAVLLQYGHGTRTGGWVEGVDYINPALRPIFEEMANEVWKEVIG
jgi:hypothetical protein